MKKLLTILILITTTIFLMPSVSANTVDQAANISLSREILPTHFIVDQEVKTYEYEDEVIYDFRDHFVIFDQREDILKTNNFVDGFRTPIDKGGYIWDFGGFSTEEVGVFTVSISYKGVNGAVVSASKNFPVIQDYEREPQVFGLLPYVEFDLGASFQDFIRLINVRDDVDGLIPLIMEQHFEGYEGIESASLNQEFNVTLRVSNKGGLTVERNFIIKITDDSAPVIYGVKNFETKKNKVIDYKEGIYAIDNTTKEEDITLIFSVFTIDSEGNKTDVDAEVDFSRTGITNVRVTATDESGNSHSSEYRIIVKDTPSFIVVVLIFNGITLATAAVVVTVVLVIKSKQKKSVDLNE